MLSAASADLVRRDWRIPGLAAVLDGGALATALGPHLRELGVHGSRLTYVRYKPRVSCLVVQELSTKIGSVDVYAKAYAEPTAGKVEKARREPMGSGVLPGTLVLERQSIVARFFPNDAKLRNISALRDEGLRNGLIEKLLGDESRRGLEKLAVLPLHPLAYKPERRYVARLGGDEATAFVLRFYRRDAFERVYRARNCFSSSGSLLLARRLGRSRRHCIVALEWLLGRRLRERLRQPAWSGEPLRRTAAALAEFHEQHAGSLPVRTREAEALRLRQLAEQLSFLVPRLAKPVTDLVGQLVSWLSEQPPPAVPIHGDFYDKQVLLAEDRIGLLDLDEVVIGDPRADVGTFIAHLERDVVRGDFTDDRVAVSEQALLAGYADASAMPTAEGWSKYAAIALIQLAHHPFRSGESNWAEQTAEILDRAATRASATDGLATDGLAVVSSHSPASLNDSTGLSPVRGHETAIASSGLRIVSLNQDPGVGPTRMKGAAVHLCAMREAFARLESVVVAIDDSEESRVANRLKRVASDGPIHLIYERYALAKSSGAEFARDRGIPYVLEVNSALAEESRRWRGRRETDDDRDRDRFLFRQADCVVAVSQPVADYAIARGARPSVVQIWANGVDLDRFRPSAGSEALRRHLVPQGRFAIGFHGRLRPWHGFDLLAEACRRLLTAGASIHLVAVGKGDFEKALDGYVGEDFRTLLGWQHHDEVGRHVACFDALPLTYGADQPCYFSPLKLGEAMACEVVPVVPAVGDLPHMVEHGSDGLIYPAGSIDHLTAALGDLIASPKLRRALGKKARESAGRHTWARIAESVLSFAR